MADLAIGDADAEIAIDCELSHRRSCGCLNSASPEFTDFRGVASIPLPAPDVHVRGCMGNKSEELKARALRFALAVMRLVDTMPGDPTTRHLTGQLVRASNRVAANYRATCRARSLAEFVAKMGTVAEEADESLHWPRILAARDLMGPGHTLVKEADELVAIFSRSCATAKRRLRGSRS